MPHSISQQGPAWIHPDNANWRIRANMGMSIVHLPGWSFRDGIVRAPDDRVWDVDLDPDQLKAADDAVRAAFQKWQNDRLEAWMANKDAIIRAGEQF